MHDLSAMRVVEVRVMQVGRRETGEVGLQPQTVLDERLRGTRFVSLTPRSVLNSPTQTGMPFWSLNPYVGCEFGCSYCYARYAHRYVVERAHDAGKLSSQEFRDLRGAHGWEAFEQRIFVKSALLQALESDLTRFHRIAGPEDLILIGTATDPYQPAERRFRLTQGVLERLARCEGLSIGITTKSPLVTRDVELLKRLQAHNDLRVQISLISLDAALVRRLEVRSPVPATRLRALRRLTDAGVNAGLIVAPVLPGITDSRAALDQLFGAARAAGARFVHSGPLRLYPGIRERFLPVLGAHFPALARRYRKGFARTGTAPEAYRRALSRRLAELRRAHGFGEPERAFNSPRAPWQFELGLATPS
ncbi:MAG TPA: radical SAM protein [Gemmatimonadales bacterium]|nr:radical SAM protein [Gemmatimonadales bacterium]